MSTFFLSYARLDQDFALKLADDLIAAGAQVWVDQYDIHPSQHWDRAVETAVRGCAGVIVVLSPRSAASPNVADEVAVALDDGKLVIPVLMETCKLPLRMARMQFIDATKHYQTALAKCLTAIGEGRAPGAEGGGASVEGGLAPPPRSALPGETLRQAELRLTGIMGPIAGVLVRQAARAETETELYEQLARAINDEAERRSFLAWVAEPPASEGRVANPRRAPAGETPPAAGVELDDEALKQLTKVLTRYLGPIAGAMVARERRTAGTKAALCQRLAERIAGEKDRAAFLRETLFI